MHILLFILLFIITIIVFGLSVVGLILKAIFGIGHRFFVFITTETKRIRT